MASIAFGYFIYTDNVDTANSDSSAYILTTVVFIVIGFVVVYLLSFVAEFALKLMPKIFVSFFKVFFLIVLFDMFLQEVEKNKGVR